MRLGDTHHLFGDLLSLPPPTQGIKYAGSKLKLLPHIMQLARQVDARTVLDGFSGTTRVAQAFAKCGYTVIANDVAVWSEVFGTCYLKNKKHPREYAELINHLNALPLREGWFTEHYGGSPNGGSAVQADGLKKPWQIHNTRKLDAIRAAIDDLNLAPVDKAVALTSLILALDQVDNTLGHYASYLNEWSPRSYNQLQLQIPKTFISEAEHQVYRGDIFDLRPEINVDLAYLDPPYGSGNVKMPPSRVRYASYYHLWTTICLNDKPPLFGKTGRRRDSSDPASGSVFEEFRKNSEGRYIVVEVLDRLIRDTQAKWIILSYSSGGRAGAQDIYAALTKYGTVLEARKIDYKRNVMAGMKWTNEWVPEGDEPHQEFLFLFEKT